MSKNFNVFSIEANYTSQALSQVAQLEVAAECSSTLPAWATPNQKGKQNYLMMTYGFFPSPPVTKGQTSDGNMVR